MAFRQDYNLLSDDELVKIFQSDDSHGAFTALVMRYQKRIYFAARRMVDGDHSEADEIAQDTFVKAYESLPGFRGDSKFYTWIYRIMVNTVIGRARKTKSRQSVDIDDLAHTLESQEPTADQMVESRETKRLIERAIETLPPKQKEVFLMRFYDELPYEEIGQILGTSVGGLKANYFHAVKKIGEFLNQSGRIAPEQVEKALSN